MIAHALPDAGGRPGGDLAVALAVLAEAARALALREDLDRERPAAIGVLARAARHGLRLGLWSGLRLRDGGQSPFAFGFTLAGRRFSTKLTVQGKWMDSKALDLVDRATAATDRHGRFYQLEGNGENTPIIYLTPAQYRAFKDESLARFPSAAP